MSAIPEDHMPPLPVHPTASQVIPDWRRLQSKVIPTGSMPQTPPASDRDQVMILHFLFAVKDYFVRQNVAKEEAYPTAQS
jgi:hypothetical protein